MWRGWLDICHATLLFYVVALETCARIAPLPDRLCLANVPSSGAIQAGLAEVKGDDVGKPRLPASGTSDNSDDEQANLIFVPLITR